MMVGTTGIDRVVRRTAELMREHNTDDIAPHGGIPLDIIQRYLNFHYSVSLDLFGGERSTNVANYFTAGLKGRWQEERRDDDHRLTDASAEVELVVDGRVETVRIPALTALNQDLRSEYFTDCNNGVRRWNRILETAGIDQTLSLPHHGFNRRVGAFAGLHVTPAGHIIDTETWERDQMQWLPTPYDFDHVKSLMQPVFEPGRMAGWIAPPATGINGQPVDYEYVRLA